MKIAELLIRKGIVKKQLSEFESTIVNNVRVQENILDECEEIEPILEQIAKKYDELRKIGKVIGICNHTFEVTPGQTIDEALVMRDLLTKRLGKVRDMYRSTKQDRNGYRETNEVKYVNRISPLRLREMIDTLQEELHTLETDLQVANWKYEVPESALEWLEKKSDV